MKELTSKTKVIAIAAPTASGKTRYAIELAQKIGGEIISADSRIVYKGFDIATAKPTLDERCGIKHYLIDIVEPEIDYTAANFYDDAKAAIKEITEKGKIPIIVGGTGLYFRILLEGYSLPRVAPDYEYRKSLEEKSAQELYEMIKSQAPEKLEKIHINNKVRLIRTLEILRSGGIATTKENEFDVEWIGLKTDREELYRRIDARVDEMMKDGLVAETQHLLEKHGRIKNFVNTIGYSEILDYFDGKTSLEEAISLIKQNSRHYAKRQLTWFRRTEALGFRKD